MCIITCLCLYKFLQICIGNLGVKFVGIVVLHHFDRRVRRYVELTDHLGSLLFIRIGAVNRHANDFGTIDYFTIILVCELRPGWFCLLAMGTPICKEKVDGCILGTAWLIDVSIGFRFGLSPFSISIISNPSKYA